MRSTRCRSGRRCSKGGGERRRSLATAFRPRLEALDDRLVPDASPTTPPVTTVQVGNPTVQEQTSTLHLNVGDWYEIGQRDTQKVYVTRTAEQLDWVVFRDDVNRTFAATVLNASAGYNPAAGTTAFTPDASTSSLVWDQAAKTFFTAPVGYTFPAAVTGFIANGMNCVFLPQPPDPLPKPTPPGTGGDNTAPKPPGTLPGTTPPIPDVPPGVPPTIPDTPLPVPRIPFDPAAGLPKPLPVPGGGAEIVVTPDKKDTLVFKFKNGGVVKVLPDPNSMAGDFTIERIPGREVLPPPKLVEPLAVPPGMAPLQGIQLGVPGIYVFRLYWEVGK